VIDLPIASGEHYWEHRQAVAEEGGTVFSSLSSLRIPGLSRVLTSIEALWKRFSERIFILFKWDFGVVLAAALNMLTEIKRSATVERILAY
jgi:hypothetical protein